MSDLKINDFGIIRDLTPEEVLEFAAATPTQTRAQWEANAKRRADALLSNAISLMSQVRQDLYAPGSADYIAMTTIITTLRRLTAVTSLAASQDETSAYNILLAAYNAAVASAPTTAKQEYAAAVRQLRGAGVKI